MKTDDLMFMELKNGVVEFNNMGDDGEWLLVMHKHFFTLIPPHATNWVTITVKDGKSQNEQLNGFLREELGDVGGRRYFFAVNMEGRDGDAYNVYHSSPERRHRRKL